MNSVFCSSEFQKSWATIAASSLASFVAAVCAKSDVLTSNLARRHKQESHFALPVRSSPMHVRRYNRSDDASQKIVPFAIKRPAFLSENMSVRL